MRSQDKRAAASAREELVGLIRGRAENLFETHQFLCAETVLYVLNQGLRGGLPPEAAIRLSSGFSEGIGGVGCICGAFSGALMAVGLFLGRQGSSRRGPKSSQARSKELYDRFRSKFRSPCCRILTKKFKDDDKALFKHCTAHTAEVAELTARFILEARPDLVEQADWDFLAAKDSKLKAGLNRFLTMVKG
ncbi:MAG: C-GCAxxG-C-C family protein [Desulfobacterales bacterium]|nr:MAG: C-GCAxxG-C-C family protein [Desulfobacterales bacterium]